MKRLLIPFLLLTAVIGYVSCQKNNSSDLASVNAAKTEGIKKGEPVNFSVQNTSGLATKWSVNPATNVTLTTDGDKATVYFRKSGSYSVLADMGGAIQRIMVSVTDSSFCDSLRRDSICGFPTDTIPHNPGDTTRPDTTCKNCVPHDSTFALTFDHINITPIRIDTGGVSGLAIIATTRNYYACSFNSLTTGFSNANGSYLLIYPGVFVPGGCTSGPVQATSTRVLYPITDGTHAFKVNVSGNIYTGSFTKAGTHYNFNWSDTSKVTISTLIIN